MKLSEYINPVRVKNETYEQYRIRRCSANYHIKDLLSGTLVWNSTIKGTYRKNVKK